MNLHTALLATVTVSALLVAACGGSADDGSSASTSNESSGSAGSQTASSSGGSATNGGSSGGTGSQTASSGSATASSGTNDSGTPWYVHTGNVMGSCGSTTTITVRWDFPEWFAYDAPMVFLAQPGPVTATLLATPARDWSWGHFNTYYMSQGAGGDLGFTSDDRVGKSVTTVSIPGQPPGVPLIFSTLVTSPLTAMGSLVSTGWVYENGFSCCDGIVRVPAKVSFGANNTAIVTFDSLGGTLPDNWSTTPLRIQLTNVTSVSGCSVQ